MCACACVCVCVRACVSVRARACLVKRHLASSPHLPVKVELLHGSVHLGHDVVRAALAADAQVPLGLLDGQRLGPGGVEGVQRAAGLGAVGQQRRHPLGVGLDARRQRHALLHEGALRRAGRQVELAGLRHDAPVVYDQVVGHRQLVLGGTGGGGGIMKKSKVYPVSF